MDFQHFWKERTWSFQANGVFSRVEGSKEAISATQTSIGHLFQRSTADHVSVDSNRTSLAGHGGTITLAKYGGKPGKLGQLLKFQTGATWRSPELELNDIGFMQTADEMDKSIDLEERDALPGDAVRSTRPHPGAGSGHG